MNAWMAFNILIWYFSVLTLVLPAAFFAALSRGTDAGVSEVAGETESPALLSDDMRGRFLAFSRGMAIILLVM